MESICIHVFRHAMKITFQLRILTQNFQRFILNIKKQKLYSVIFYSNKFSRLNMITESSAEQHLIFASFFILQIEYE